ncbi:hypothetical protein HDE_02061 [Halotydeus destructor]|nr:hypothetical protein HDE_02061 [Halotydeus destructor]
MFVSGRWALVVSVTLSLSLVQSDPVAEVPSEKDTVCSFAIWTRCRLTEEPSLCADILQFKDCVQANIDRLDQCDSRQKERIKQVLSVKSANCGNSSYEASSSDRSGVAHITSTRLWIYVVLVVIAMMISS